MKKLNEMLIETTPKLIFPPPDKGGSLHRSQTILPSVCLKSVDLPDSIYDDFVSLLTYDKIKLFSENTKAQELELRCEQKRNTKIKIKITHFFNIMNQTFPENAANETFQKGYEKIFARFKALICEVKGQSNKRDNFYIIHKGNTKDDLSTYEIDSYEISCAGACFVKCDFNVKLKMLFELSDVDDDGFINTSEVRNLIYTINNIFATEEQVINSGSTIVNQSGAAMKSQQSYNLIMKFPGMGNKTIVMAKYINFEQLYDSVVRIPGYKYKLIPGFVNFKTCLHTVREEQTIEVRQKNGAEFSMISSEIIAKIKARNDIGNSTCVDFKKNGDPVGKEQARRGGSKLVKKINGIKTSAKVAKPFSAKKGSHTLKKPSANPFVSANQSTVPTSPNHWASKPKEDAYEINYNKICGLEAYPCVVSVTEPNKQNHFPGSLGKRTEKAVRTPYMSFGEIINEIEMLVNKHKKDDQTIETLIAISNTVSKLAETKIRLGKDKNPLPKGVFGKYEKWQAKE